MRGALAGQLSAALVLLAALAACTSSACDTRPITASLAGPGNGADSGVALGACLAWVDYEGRLYRDVREAGHELQVLEVQLTYLGRARGATERVAPLANDSVFAIDGVDAQTAIAMHGAPGSQPTIVVFYTDPSGGFPAALCPLASQSSNDPTIQSVCGRRAP